MTLLPCCMIIVEKYHAVVEASDDKPGRWCAGAPPGALPSALVAFERTKQWHLTQTLIPCSVDTNHVRHEFGLTRFVRFLPKIKHDLN